MLLYCCVSQGVQCCCTGVLGKVLNVMQLKMVSGEKSAFFFF